MKQKLNSKGFAVLETLLILVIGAIIGGTGYYVYQTYNKSTDTQNAAQTNANAAVPSKKKTNTKNYLTIKEWGVHAPISASITPQYSVITDNQQAWAQLSSDQLTAADPACNVEHSGGGIISRAKPTDHVFNDGGEDLGGTIQKEIDEGNLQNYKKVGDYYYWYKPGQGACGSGSQLPQSLEDLETQTRAAFKAAISNLEAVH